MNVKIYQAPVEYNNKFMGYQFTMNHGGIDESQYQCIYEADLPLMGLDDLYQMCNTSRPEGYRGHSLSVSDIVVLDGQAYFCDSFGWKSISFGGWCK